MPDNLEPITQTPTISPTQPEPEVITPQSQLPPADPNPIPSQTNVASDASDSLPTKPKSNRPLLVGIVLLALLLGGIGGYYLKTSSTTAPSEVATSTPTQNIPVADDSSLAQAEPDPTADWKTYSDANNTFLFKYPNKLSPHECRPTQHTEQDSTLIITSFFPQNSQPAFSEYCDSPITDDLQIRHSSQEISEDIFLSNDYVVNSTAIIKGDMKIARTDAEKSNDSPGPKKWSIIKFVSNNKHYMVLTDYRLLNESEFDQILSTFTFNNQAEKEDDIPSNWKSQTMQTEMISTHFKSFTIFYPPDWIANKTEYPNIGFDMSLAKKDTKILIRQGEFGWGTCSFPDKFIGEDGMITQMTQMFPDITLNNNVIWRIAKPADDGISEHISVCQMNPDESAEYNERFMGATQAGMITIENANSAMLEEVAQILSRIEIQN